MTASNMQRLSQFASSSLLLLFGLAVVTASLNSLHARQTFASQGNWGEHEQGKTAGSRLHQLMNEELPGSLPYVFSRGVDKMTLIFDEKEEKVVHLLRFSQERAVSARVAQEQGMENESFVTFSKAVAYYHLSLAACRDLQPCEPHHEQFYKTKTELLEISGLLINNATDNAIRARLEGLSHELEMLPQPTL